MPRRYEEWEISLCLRAIIQAVIAWRPWIPTGGPAWNRVPWVVPCPQLGVRCYLGVTYAGWCEYIPPRRVWLSLPWTLWSCGEETTWTSVSRSNSKTMLGSRRCPEVEWAPEEGNSGAQSHWNRLCWPPAGKLQVNPELLSRRGDPRTLENNFASKNIQGAESVTVPPKNKPELSGLLSILKHLTRSWEALGVLRLWATLSRLWDSSSAASSVRWK